MHSGWPKPLIGLGLAGDGVQSLRFVSLAVVKRLVMKASFTIATQRRLSDDVLLFLFLCLAVLLTKRRRTSLSK